MLKEEKRKYKFVVGIRYRVKENINIICVVWTGGRSEKSPGEWRWLVSVLRLEIGSGPLTSLAVTY